LSSIGLNPQRMGTPIDKSETATGIEQAIAASYAQTEQYFIQHSDELMPKVHQMRTDLAQFYQSTNPSIRLQYVTKDDEKVMFMLNGEELIGRDINVTCHTRVGMRNILENIKQMMLKDNTTGTTLWDRIRTIKADDMVDLENGLKAMENRYEKEQAERSQQEQQAQQAEQEHQIQLQQQAQQFEAEQKQLDRDAHIQEAEIRAAGFSGSVDINQNKQNDYLDNLKFIQGQQEYSGKINLEKEKHLVNTRLKETDQQIQMRKISEEGRRTTAMLKVAKINDKVKEKNKKS